MSYLTQKLNPKMVIGITIAIILISIFIPAGTVDSGTVVLGERCDSNSDCASGSCLFNVCLAPLYSTCNSDAECAGSATRLMACDSGICKGRHAYPCQNVPEPIRDAPECHSGFHCDLSGTLGYNYCEGNHPPTPDPTCTISANPSSINQGSSSTLTWTSSNAVSCTANGGWSGTKALNGNGSVSPTTTTQYSLTCANSVNTTYTCQTSVNVNITPPTLSLDISKMGRNITTNTSWAEITNALPGQTISFSIRAINNGNGVVNNVTVNDLLPYNLTYTAGSTKVDNVSVADGIISNGINIGSISVGQYKTIVFNAVLANGNSFPYGQTTLTNISGTWASGVPNVTDTAKVVVTRAPPAPDPTCTISANPSSINQGSSSTLTWTSSNAVSCTANGGWSGTKALNGNGSVSPTTTTQYSLTCANSVNTTYTCQTSVNVNVHSNPYLVITKSVDKTTANPGDEIVYTLNYQNTGLGIANNVVITDPFINLNQNYLTFVSSVPVQSHYPNAWNIGTLGSGSSGTITIRARISSNVPTGTTQIQNRASIDSNETSVVYSNYVSTWIYSNTGNINLSIEKLVRNISDGSGSFRSSVDTDSNDEVEFSIEIRNNSSVQAENVRVWDNLPSHLEYINNSTKLDGSNQGDGIIGSGLYIGEINANGSKTIKFKARVKDYSYYGTQVLTNYAYANADNYHTISDTAIVRINYQDNPDEPGLSIDKLVRNITRGNSSFTTSVYAQSGDELEFLLKIHSIGNDTAENIRVRDALPSQLTYIAGSTTIDGSYRLDGIISTSGIHADDLAVGRYREVKFKARANSVNSTISVTNYGYTWASDVSRIYDTARITIQKETTPSTRALSISKLGRNVSRGITSFADSVLASPSQEIEFSIQVTNIGNGDLNNVRVWDAVPYNLSLIAGSTTIDNVTWGGDATGSGINLGTLNQGQSKTIRFRATITGKDNFGAGNTSLINTAFANADNTSQVSDQASVIVYKPGEVKGITTIKTGANDIGLVFLGIISAFIALFIYCLIREDKLNQILADSNNRLVKGFIGFYFKIKFAFTISKLRLKRFYW